MSHRIKVLQETTIIDVAICTITDAELAELNQLRSEGDVYKVRDFLLECTHDADEWHRRDNIDGEMPHAYELHGAEYSAVDL
jgi:hypothetical protein